MFSLFLHTLLEMVIGLGAICFVLRCCLLMFGASTGIFWLVAFVSDCLAIEVAFSLSRFSSGLTRMPHGLRFVSQFSASCCVSLIFLFCLPLGGLALRA